MHDGSVSRPRTVICKLHDITVDTAKEADVIIMSHRDPYETICSRRMSNDGQGNWRNWCKNPLHLRKRTDENKEEWDAAVDACLEGNFYEETKDQCRTLLGLQAEVYARREAHGKKIAYDVPLVGWQTEPSKHIGNVARAMGICEAAVSKNGTPTIVCVSLSLSLSLSLSPFRPLFFWSMLRRTFTAE